MYIAETKYADQLQVKHSYPTADRSAPMFQHVQQPGFLMMRLKYLLLYIYHSVRNKTHIATCPGGNLKLILKFF